MHTHACWQQHIYDAAHLHAGRGSKEEWRSVERSLHHFQTSSIVSLAPHCTEILFALGLGHRVIGVTVTLLCT